MHICQKEQLEEFTFYAFKEIRIWTIIQTIHRLFSMFYMIVVWIVFLAETPFERAKFYGIFLTNQTFMLTFLYFFLGFCSCISIFRFVCEKFFLKIFFPETQRMLRTILKKLKIIFTFY
jgi:hypothetical protein